MRLALILLVAGTLCLSASGGAVSGMPTQSPPSNAEFGVADAAHVLAVTPPAGNNSSVLWSRDRDDESDGADVESNTSERPPLVALADEADLTWTHPPKRASVWTRESFAAFARNFSSDGDRSVYPDDATLRASERGLIQDAHATLFALTPSTVVKRSANGSRQYVAPDGVARALIDYRVTTGEQAAGNWTIQDHRVESVCLVQDRAIGADSASPCTGPGVVGVGGGQTPTLDYTLARPGSVSQLTLAAKIVVTAERSVFTDCESGRCQTTRQTTQESVTVTETRTVRVAGQRATVRTARFPDGDQGLVVQHARPWSGLRMMAHSGQDASVATTRWRFFTARNPSWETLVTETATGQHVRASPAWPARVYAVPAERERARSVDPRVSSLQVTHARSAELSTPAPTLAETVHVGVVEDAYRPTQSVAIRSAESVTAATITGLVRGQTLSMVALGQPTQVHRSTLSLAVAAHNRTHATVRVRLQDNRTGEPIDLRDRPGSVTVQGRSVNTNASGVVIVTVPFNGAVSAEYTPARWWHVGSVAYLGDDDQVVVASSLFSVHSLAQLFTRLGAVGLPLAVVLYLVDQLPGTRAWPPWKLLR